MQWLRWLLIVYLLVAGKLAVGTHFESATLLPDAIAVVGVWAILTMNHPLSFVAAAGIGLVGDVYWGGRIGLWMFTLCSVAYWLGGIRKWFDLQHPFRAVACAWVLAATHDVAAAAIDRLLRGAAIDWETASWHGLWRGLLAAVVVVGAEAGLQALVRRLRLVFHPASN